MEILKQIDQSLSEGYQAGAKVVRDGIVDNQNWVIEWGRVLSDSEFEVGLANKGVEEAREARKAIRRGVHDDSEEAKRKVLEEFADQLTLIESYMAHKGWPMEVLHAVKEQKDLRMGTFEEKRMMKSVRRRNG